MDRSMEDLKMIICKELEEIAEKGEMSAGDLDAVYKLIVAKEKLLRIEELEETLGYSEDGGWRAEGSYARGNSYEGRSYNGGGNSYNGGGNSYGNRSYSRGRYSRSRGYSMADGKEMIVEQIREMMDDQSLPAADRSALKKAMEQLQR